jgi:hypothetical protein
VHINFRRVVEAEYKIFFCNGQCQCRRKMLTEFEEWYGWTVTCLRCGDSWQDGEMLPRPFERAWRERRVASAKKTIKRYEEQGLLKPRKKRGTLDGRQET